MDEMQCNMLKVQGLSETINLILLQRTINQYFLGFRALDILSLNQ